MDNYEFDYAAEQAKIDFQANIGSLQELITYLDSKQLKALEEKRNGVFLTHKEITGLKDWINRATANLMGDYVQLDRTNRNAMRLYSCAMKVREKKTPDIKKLLA